MTQARHLVAHELGLPTNPEMTREIRTPVQLLEPRSPGGARTKVPTALTRGPDGRPGAGV